MAWTLSRCLCWLLCMSRGRAERMAFAKTFEPAYHFRLLYLPGQLYPIMGALRYCAGESWQVRFLKCTPLLLPLLAHVVFPEM